ncbi:unnamed protein product [Dibothriocephalus latus]|uniref:Uncharacterized protein n=1 Tax=Dibothriocephalus latus TaxID=60516 RepID=A0A3P6ULC9_DIBLA|nr:unnamed protein product [Dibothriocephalus latus]
MRKLIGDLDGADLGVLIAYFVIVFAVGIWASPSYHMLTSSLLKSSCRNRGSVGGYFLAGRSMHWIPVGASLFASNIGSGHFIGLAGSGASSGIAIAAVFILALLGWLFLPVYIVSGIVTMPEYLRKRLGGQRIRVYLAVIALLLYVFSKISADLYAGGIFIQLSMKISMYPAVIMLLIMSALFTIMGGLTAVIWTDFAQTIIMIGGALYLMIRSLQVTGGFDSMVAEYLNAIPNTTRAYQSTPFTATAPLNILNFQPDLYGTPEEREAILDLATPEDRKLGIYAECSIPPTDTMNFFKSLDNTYLPWVGVVFGLSVNATWYWCTDQVIVQRTLAAKNLVNAKAGIILACFCKMLPLWLMIVPGMAARILFTDTVTCGSAELCKKICGKAVGCSDIAYPSLVLNILPSGARGLMIAVMMASLVSSLTSIFNSSSTIFTVDIWKLIRPNCRDAELMIVGRVCVIVLVGVSIAWIPIVQLSDELFNYIQSVTAYLAPPICAVYVLAVFWKRTNEIGCFVSLIAGLAIGIIRFGWELGYPKTPCGQISTKPPHDLIQMHFLHFSILLFAISSLIIVSVSLITPPLPEQYVRRLVFAERHRKFDQLLDGPKLTIVSDEDKEAYDSKLEQNRPVIPWWKKALRWICGTEDMQDANEPVYTKQEAAALTELTRKQLSIQEAPLQAFVVNSGMAFVLGLTVFIWGFLS